MGFGASVSALLETYSNCISLLKTYQRRGGDADSRGIDQQSLLRRSLKTDRATVRRTYSSRLSQSGGQFEKGDAPARSALTKVLRRLSAAIVNLLHLASRKDRTPALDYDSLMSLSNSSRVQAVKAMDQLSQRLAGPSSRSSAASSSSSASHKRRKTPGSIPKPASEGGGKTRGGVKKATGQRPPRGVSPRNRSDQGEKSAAKTSGKMPPPTSPARKPSAPSKLEKSSSPGSSPGSNRQSRQHRMSMMTVSSGSTKLGEVPERRRHAGHLSDYSPEEYNVRPAYPLRPYKPEVKERRFWGLFRRG